MKGPFRRISESVHETRSDVRDVTEQVSAMALVGLIAFSLIAIVAVSALIMATDGRAR